MENAARQEAADTPSAGARFRPLSAALFSACGKLSVTVLEMSDEGAIGFAGELPPCDSFAFLVRNGIKMPATVAWADGQRFGLTFETPQIDARLREAFQTRPGHTRSRRPISADHLIAQ